MELDEALNLALGMAIPVASEDVGIMEAVGRVLAEPFSAPYDLPREPRSRVDGYALRSEDVIAASERTPVSLELLPEKAVAGWLTASSVAPGTTMRILTGAVLPGGADSVLLQEHADFADGRIRVKSPLRTGQGLNHAGSDAREGELLLSRGALLTPTRLAILAAFGREAVPVGRRPVVALLATGDELRESGEMMLEGSWTVCNNRYLLGWLVASAGGVPLHLGIARDDPSLIAEKLEAREADVVISTGGTGQGDRDFLLQAWERLGVRTIFTRIRLSPGKHTALGVRGRQIYFGLSGNPWAARAVFQELIAPVIRKIQGLLEVSGATIPAVLNSPVSNRGGLGRIVSGRLVMSGCPPVFAPDAKRPGTSAFSGVSGRFAYILLNSHVVEIPNGCVVRVRLHDLPSLASDLIHGPDPHDEDGKDSVAYSL